MKGKKEYLSVRGVDKINAQEQLTELINQYQNLVFSICCKMTGDYFAAEDLTQETFLSAFSHINSFTGDSKKAWLCRIAANKCVDYLRTAGKRMIPSETETLEKTPDRTAGPEEHVLEKEVRTQLLKHCTSLKPPYDTIARLYFYEEKKAEEIAQMQNKKLKTVQTQVYRARAMLRKLYERERRL